MPTDPELDGQLRALGERATEAVHTVAHLAELYRAAVIALGDLNNALAHVVPTVPDDNSIDVGQAAHYTSTPVGDDRTRVVVQLDERESDDLLLTVAYIHAALTQLRAHGHEVPRYYLPHLQRAPDHRAEHCDRCNHGTWVYWTGLRWLCLGCVAKAVPIERHIALDGEDLPLPDAEDQTGR